MKRTQIKQIKEHISKQICIKGFVQKIRGQSKIKFLILRDITGTIQCICTSKDESLFEQISKITPESVVSIIGLVKEEKQAPSGVELKIEKIEILSLSEDLPIQVIEKNKTETTLPKRLDYRWIDIRKTDKLKIFQVWTSLEIGMRKYFEKEKFMQIYTPSFMSTPSESGAEVFEVKYFETTAYLSQSPQFYKQMALAGGFEKVFVVGPVFRAEKSNTTRHLTQFTGWDFEVSYVDEIKELIDIEEDMIISCFKQIEIDKLIDIKIPQKPFPTITMKQAKEILKLEKIKSEKDYDLSPEEERKLSQIIEKKFKHEFVFLTDFPTQGRPFYHKRYDEDKTLTKSFDLLYKGIEITTGAIREHKLEILKKQAIDKEMDLESLEQYFEFFKYGCPPHGGCGLGPERIIMKLLDLETIKEATLLPRDVTRLTP
ncbi:MAG: aspartate--tRNA(Asn) ligase [Nanoarchaeales archaeon]|nr:aspartate--tRNA(Asn) ligase [Nanoarchaeales archaeon]